MWPHPTFTMISALLKLPFLSLFLILLPCAHPHYLSLSTSVHVGFTYDPCTFTSPGACKRDRVCSSQFNNICTPFDSQCYCLPTAPQPCTASADCQTSERCAQDPDFRTFCASKSAVKRFSFLSAAPLLPNPSSTGLTLDDCSRREAVCKEGRTCQPARDVGNVCQEDDDNCLCIPPRDVFRTCLQSAVCEKGELCAQVQFFQALPFCVAATVPSRRLAAEEVVYPDPKGYTLDPCERDEGCVGNRECVKRVQDRILGGLDGLGPCDASGVCFCAPPTGELVACFRTSECSSRDEVCAGSAFFGVPICVSIGARDAYQHINQVSVGDTCPVLFGVDLPKASRRVRSNSAGAPTALGDGNLAERFKDRAGFSSSVVGGLIASDGLRRYMAGVFTSIDDEPFFCSAVLISKRWIMMAAHCNIRVGSRVAIGQSEVEFSDTRSFTTVIRFFTHPRFDIEKRFDLYDIVVAELAMDAPSGSKFMKVNEKVRIPEDNSAVRVIGYGLQFENDISPFRLRQVDVTVVNSKTCEKFYSNLIEPSRIFGKLQVCIRSEREGCGQCYGDSGSPLIQYIRNEPIIVGIAASLVECDTTKYPQIYTRVAGVINFLKSTPAIFFSTGSKESVDNPPCLAGEFLTKRKKCVPCSKNKVSRGGKVRKCKLCKRGFRRDSTDGAICSCRGENAAGKGMVGKSCRICPAGTFSGIGDDTCRACGSGLSSGRGAIMCS